MATKSVSLFDLLLVKSKSKSKKTPPPQQHQQRHVTEAPLRTFVVRPKAKKGLSSFKKKILLERLAVHRLNNGSDSGVASPAADDDSVDRVLRLEGFVGEVSDEDELAELLQNARDLVQRFAPVESAEIKGRDIFLRLSSSKAADLAAQALGDTIVCGDLVRAQSVEFDATSGAGVEVRERGIVQLRLSNLVDSDDVEDADCAAEVLRDVAQMLPTADDALAIWIEQATVSSAAADHSRICNCNSPPPLLCTALLELSEDCSIAAFAGALSSTPQRWGLLGLDFVHGDPVLEDLVFADAFPRQCFVRLIGFVDADQLQDEQEAQEIRDNIGELCGSFIGSLEVSLEVSGTGSSHYDAVIRVATLADCLTLAGRVAAVQLGGERVAFELSYLIEDGSGRACTLLRSDAGRLCVGVLTDSLPPYREGNTAPRTAALSWLKSAVPAAHIVSVRTPHRITTACPPPSKGLPSGARELSVVVGFDCREFAELALVALDCRVVGGAVVLAELRAATESSDVIAAVEDVVPPLFLNAKSSSAPKRSPSGYKLLSRYVQAKAAGKLPRRSAPTELWQQAVKVLF
jgi:hypothetical protein